MLININDREPFAVFVLYLEMIVYSRTRLLLAVRGSVFRLEPGADLLSTTSNSPNISSAKPVSGTAKTAKNRLLSRRESVL